MRVLVAGCGYVGNALARRLVAAGHEVHGLRRRIEALPPGVHPVAADLAAPDLPALPVVDALVYTASAGGRTEEAYRTIYVDGLRRVIERLEASGSALERVIFTSSTAVYGQTGGEWVDETSATEPASFSGRILLEAEAVAIAHGRHGVALRLAGIYGPGRTRLVRQVFEDQPSDSPDDAFGNRIHVDDCAGALAHLLELPSPAAVYCGVDDAPVPLGEVRDHLAAALGVARQRNRSHTGTERGHKRVSNARLVGSGYALSVPTYREGYGPVVEAFLRGEGRTEGRIQS